MRDKCTKCGAEIPADSKFCLQCGEKVSVEMRAAAAPPTEHVHLLLRSIFSKDFIVAGVLLGLLFAWIGTIVLTLSMPPTDYTGIKAALILNNLGFFIIGVFLIGGGIVNNAMDKFVRFGMIFGGSFLMAYSLVLSFSGVLSILASAYRG
jgi:predicted nucleic acid-binding Zn ribbon protein